MTINKSIDIEDEIRQALAPYQNIYCRPLPEDYGLPNLLVTRVGGTDASTIDSFEVVLDARARLEANAVSYLDTAIGLLKAIAREQTTAIRYVTVNSSGSWGADPVRPDLCMCSARLMVVAHKNTMEV